MKDFISKHRFFLNMSVVSTLVVFVLLTTFFSALTAVGIFVGTVMLTIAFVRPLWILSFLAVYFPLEPFLVKFVPEQLFLYVRFAPEVLLYFLIGVVLFRYVRKRRLRPHTPIDLPFALLIVTIITSIVINLLEPMVAMVGTRQILRFMLVFFIAVYLRPSKRYIRTLTIVMLGLVAFESLLGISQVIFGEPLDAFLFPSEGRFLGDIILRPNSFRFWDPGSRVFATMGRYDRLGTFLGMFLLFASGILYEMKSLRKRRELWLVFLVGLPALALTYSRSGWFGFVLGFLLIAWFLKKDHRVKLAAFSFILIVSGYLIISGVVVGRLIDVPQQTITERFFEAFSYSRWRGEYYGVGRLFWIVNTPIHVIPASPFFGHGPGTFGGGAVSALRNTKVYDQLGLPFGVAGTEGYVDNNWLSIWGELGTLGLAFYIWIIAVLFAYSLRVWKKAHDPFIRALALGFCGVVIAFILNAFLASFLETRTLAFYFWLYAGFIVVLGDKDGIRL